MFYERLISLCERNSIKPTVLLKELNLSPGNLKRWKEGASVNSDILQKISEYFGVSTDYLIKGEEKTDTQLIDSFNMMDKSRRKDVVFKLLEAMIDEKEEQ